MTSYAEKRTKEKKRKEILSRQFDFPTQSMSDKQKIRFLLGVIDRPKDIWGFISLHPKDEKRLNRIRKGEI